MAYSPQLAQRICERLAAGESLRAICRDDEMPSEMTVRRWALDDVEGFASQYVRARQLQAHSLAEEIIDIANTPVIGRKTKMGTDGVEVTEGDMIEHRRLQVDARKWFLSKVLPKVYGDKIVNEHTGPDGGAIVTEVRRTIVDPKAAP